MDYKSLATSNYIASENPPCLIPQHAGYLCRECQEVSQLVMIRADVVISL